MRSVYRAAGGRRRRRVGPCPLKERCLRAHTVLKWAGPLTDNIRNLSLGPDQGASVAVLLAAVPALLPRRLRASTGRCRGTRARVWLLLAASFYFYASWNQWLALLIVVTTDARLPPRPRHGRRRLAARRRKLLLVAQPRRQPRAARATSSTPTSSSTRCEQALQRRRRDGVAAGARGASCRSASRSTRSRRSTTRSTSTGGKMPAERNLPHFLLFILFFPHLVAGPIVRGRRLPAAGRAAASAGTGPRVQLGVQLFLLGLFKKLAIADRMALFADPVFADPAAVRHRRRLAGRRSPTPCRSTATSPATPTWRSARRTCSATSWRRTSTCRTSPPNVAEFWRRWHISLSTLAARLPVHPAGRQPRRRAGRPAAT